MQALKGRRYRWFLMGLVVVVGLAATEPVRALTTILIRGVIDFVAPAADPNALAIEVGDEFLITAVFDETLLGGTELETLTPATDPSLSFELRIDRGPAVVWDEQDDLIFPFGPLINLDDGDFDSFVFQSTDFPFASDAFVQVIDDVEILDASTLDSLVRGSFTDISVSVLKAAPPPGFTSEAWGGASTLPSDRSA